MTDIYMRTHRLAEAVAKSNERLASRYCDRFEGVGPEPRAKWEGRSVVRSDGVLRHTECAYYNGSVSASKAASIAVA